jgi:putative liporotein
MLSYLKKAILLCLLAIFAVSCALEKAETEYKKGNYIKSIEITLDYFDSHNKKLESIKPKDKEMISEKFSNIITHYKNFAENGTDTEKIEANLKLFKIYTLLDTRSYAQNFTDFTGKNNPEYFVNNAKSSITRVFDYELSENREETFLNKKYLESLINDANFAHQKQTYGFSRENYVRIEKEAYETLSELYFKTAERKLRYSHYASVKKFFDTAVTSYSKYTDNVDEFHNRYQNVILNRVNEEIKAKDYESAYLILDILDYRLYPKNAHYYQKIRNITVNTKAENYIKLAIQAEKDGAYRISEKSYNSAFELNADYMGMYRENRDNSKRNADLKDAETNYNLGAQIINRGSNIKRKDYRQAVSYFKKAQKFVPGYKNTDELINKYNSMGKVRYSIVSNSSEFNRIVNFYMKDIGTQNFSGQPDIVIEYRENPKYNIVNYPVKIENLSKTVNTNRVNEKGEFIYETIYFTKNAVKSEEYGEIEFYISTRGAIGKNYKDTVTYKNSIEEITYTGNVPSEYRNTRNGSLIGKQKIMEKLQEELNNKIKSKVKQIYDSSLEI